MSLPSQDSSGKCFVPSDTVLDSGRVIRRPIEEWSRDLEGRISQLVGQEPKLDAVDRGCSALNNAALVFVHAGLPAAAEDICQSQLAWINRHSGTLAPGQLKVLAIQPWINLGRLYRRSRDYNRAREYFRAIGSEEQTDDFRAGAEPAYVYESLRTYLQSGDLDEAIRFAEELTPSLLRGSLMLKTELLIHIYLLRDDPTAVYPLINQMPWPEDRFGPMSKYFYTAVALNAAGQKDSSVDALKRLIPAFISYLDRVQADSRDLRFGIEMSSFAKCLGCRELFFQSAFGVCSPIRRSRDVLSASQLLSLAQGEEVVETDEGFCRLRNLVEDSGYVSCSKKPITPRVSGSLADLSAAISRLVGDPNRN
ncbi:MAG: tetratricopeptide repeat protein [Bryobacteraceae bacterium]